MAIDDPSLHDRAKEIAAPSHLCRATENRPSASLHGPSSVRGCCFSCLLHGPLSVHGCHLGLRRHLGFQIFLVHSL